jgi:sortase A
VLTAHNDVFGEIFRDLDRLKRGDQVTVFTNQRSYTYIITGSKIVEPDEVEVMAPTPKETLTLISCYPYMIETAQVKAAHMNN